VVGDSKKNWAVNTFAGSYPLNRCMLILSELSRLGIKGSIFQVFSMVSLPSITNKIMVIRLVFLTEFLTVLSLYLLHENIQLPYLREVLGGTKVRLISPFYITPAQNHLF